MTAAAMKPQEVTDLPLAFPASVTDLMPPMTDIPEPFKNWSGNQWVGVVDRWFFSGLPKGTELVPAEGIDRKPAVRHLKAIMGSWEPKHEHKTAAVAYLLSLWFTEIRIPGEAPVSA